MMEGLIYAFCLLFSTLYGLLTVVSRVVIFLLTIIKTYVAVQALVALSGFSINVNYSLTIVIQCALRKLIVFARRHGDMVLVHGL